MTRNTETAPKLRWGIVYGWNEEKDKYGATDKREFQYHDDEQSRWLPVPEEKDDD